MPNNPADVPPLVTLESWHAIILNAIATGAVITKSAAAEEADRARIVALTEALATADGYIIRFHEANNRDWACTQCVGADAIPSDDRNFVCVYHEAIARQALSGGSENG